MLNRSTQKRMVEVVQRTWDQQCEVGKLDGFMRRKKERGHALANYVEEHSATALKEAFGARATFGLGKDGETVERGMGDIWIESGGMFNPVNIKSGVREPGRATRGHPNLVALKRLTKALANKWIDSYYLLFVRITAATPVVANVQLVDLLHIIEDYVGFNSGPGQLMLKAARFDEPPPPTYGVVPTEPMLAYLKALRERSNERFFAAREKELREINELIAVFDPDSPIDQTALPLEAFRLKLS